MFANMPMNYILDDDLNPVPELDILKWAAWFETAERHVNLTEIDGLFVSTAFLGIDHGFGQLDAWGKPKPILYETMIYRKVSGAGHIHDTEWIDGALRYSNRTEAEWGHEAVVRAVTNRLARPMGLDRLLKEGLQLTDAD